MNMLTMKWADLIKNFAEYQNFHKEIIDLLSWMGFHSVQAIIELDENTLEGIRVPFWWVKGYCDSFNALPITQAYYSQLCTGPDIYRLPVGVKDEILSLRKYFMGLQNPQGQKRNRNRKPKIAFGNTVAFNKKTLEKTSTSFNHDIPTSNTSEWFAPTVKVKQEVHTSCVASWSGNTIKQEAPAINSDVWYPSNVKQENQTSNSGAWLNTVVKQEILENNEDITNKLTGYQYDYGSGSWTTHNYGPTRHQPEE